MNPIYKKVLGVVNGSDTAVANENANKPSETFGTQRDLIAGVVAKAIALEHMLPREVAVAHEMGVIHYHDLDYFPLQPMTNCCLVNLKDMLANGFKMGNAFIDKATNIRTAATVVTQIAASVSSGQYGGTSFNRLDEVLAPYVEATYNTFLKGDDRYGIPRLDEETAMAFTRKEVYDACQTMEYQVNTLTTSNGQVPFLTFGFGLGECQWAKLIQHAILDVRIKGLGKDKVTAIFPKLTFALKDGHNLKPQDPFYDVKVKALLSSSRRMYPDYLNFHKLEEVTGAFKTPMGCRAFLSENEAGEHDGRNNLGVVTVNIARAAMAGNNERSTAKFIRNLTSAIEVAKKGLDYRLERLADVKAENAPILYMEGALLRLKDPKEPVLQHLIDKGATISLGYLGLHEAMEYLYPERDFEFRREASLSVMELLKESVDQWKADSGVHFSLYGTPSESLCNRFNELLVAEFGEQPVLEKGYLVNSFHLPAKLGKEDGFDVYKRIDYEAPFVPYSSGGFICYGEYPDIRRDLLVLEKAVDYAYGKVPYYAVNTPADRCLECQSDVDLIDLNGEGFKCPNCGEEHNVYAVRRVSGYAGNPKARPFNRGKTREVSDRKRQA